MVSSWVTLLALLLPVAAVSGWWLGRRQATDAAAPRNLRYADYLKGLNYVLNEEPDQAIDVFIRMIEVDSETVETHFALGSLYRRRGEVDRAIRIHQNLMARPALTPEQRDAALYELAEDYMRSGILDRAEKLLSELLASSNYREQAQYRLLDIYQQEQEWEKAISAAGQLAAGAPLQREIAHFHCELAAAALAGDDEKGARRHLKQALEADPACARASMQEAQIARRAGDLAAAIRAYRRIEHQDPEYLSEVLGPLQECYREQGHLDRFRNYLNELVARFGGATPVLLLTDVTAELEGEDAALRFLSGELHKRPSVRGVDRLLQFAMARSQGMLRESMQTMRELVARLLEENARYRCIQCGYAARWLHWFCPGCRNWSTVKPLHGAAGE
jgi:lipopolysaccharide assembly protein B